MRKWLLHSLVILPLLSVPVQLLATSVSSTTSSTKAIFEGDTSDNLGFNPAANINTGSSNADIADISTKILMELVKYVGLFAVSIIIIAGILLVVSAGNDDLRERARKMIIYVAIGSLVILLAAAIVTFFITIGR